MRHASADPVRLTARLLADVLADTDQPDDVAVIAARLLPAPLEARLPADPAQLAGARRAVAAWSTAAGLSIDTVEDLQLALGEALANAVEHAYSGGGAGAVRVPGRAGARRQHGRRGHRHRHVATAAGRPRVPRARAWS